MKTYSVELMQNIAIAEGLNFEEKQRKSDLPLITHSLIGRFVFSAWILEWNLMKKTKKKIEAVIGDDIISLRIRKIANNEIYFMIVKNMTVVTHGILPSTLDIYKRYYNIAYFCPKILMPEIEIYIGRHNGTVSFFDELDEKKKMETVSGISGYEPDKTLIERFYFEP